jgi:hypothetical protein
MGPYVRSESSSAPNCTFLFEGHASPGSWAERMFAPGAEVESNPAQLPGPSRQLGRERTNMNHDHHSFS